MTDEVFGRMAAAKEDFDEAPEDRSPPPPPLQRSFQLPKSFSGKTQEEVWKEIYNWKGASSGDGSAGYEADSEKITLEDYLVRGFGVGRETGQQLGQQIPQFPSENPIPELDRNGSGIEGGGGGSGRKRPVLDPADRVTNQRQKRMIKNRESAARSRERKQAYTLELESLVTQLEEQNAMLQQDHEEDARQILNQILENVIPITEKKKPPQRLLERLHSF